MKQETPIMRPETPVNYTEVGNVNNPTLASSPTLDEARSPLRLFPLHNESLNNPISPLAETLFGIPSTSTPENASNIESSIPEGSNIPSAIPGGETHQLLY